MADAEAGDDRAERLLRAERELSDARDAADEGGSTARLIAALQEAAAEVGRAVTPTMLLAPGHYKSGRYVCATIPGRLTAILTRR